MYFENMKMVNEILAYNKKFVEEKKYEEFVATKYPNKKVVILSCMDARLTELLPKAMGLKNGDAKIVKNAGATISHPFDSIIRSIIVAVYEFDANEILVVGHVGCGMSNLNNKEVIEKMVERGIDNEIISTLINAGIDVNKWLHGFESVEDSIKESVNIIKNHPLIPKDVSVHGLIIDSHTGKLDVVVDGYNSVTYRCSY